LAFLEASDGAFWMGSGAGLARWDPEKQTGVLSEMNEIHGLSVFRILEDSEGDLWLSTPSAIYRYNREAGSLGRYDARDGLLSNSINGYGFYKTSKGEFLLGSQHGFNMFKPEDIGPNQHIPRVVLTSFLVGGNELELPLPIHNIREEVRLAHNKNTLSFEFAALDFVLPEKNEYSFMLEGFDQGWRSMRGERSVSYTNLEPGSYLFRVKGSNNDSFWSPEEAELKVRIVPSFTSTHTFYLLVVLGLLVLLLWWNHIRTSSERNLEKIVAERTHSLQEANKRLEAVAGSLRRAQDDIIESAHKSGMAEIATDVLHTIGNALNSVHVSANIVESKLAGMRIDFLSNVNDLLDMNKDRLPEFFTESKGKMLPDAIQRLSARMVESRCEIVAEIKQLNEQLFYINELVMRQREYAFEGNFYENLDVKNMIEDVLRIQEAQFDEFHIKVCRTYVEEIPKIRGAKAILLHIFNHMIKNACEALYRGGTRENRLLSVYLMLNERGNIRLEIQDNGIGIEKNLQTLIFSHGFAKKDGRRGSLHYCANAISEMGGSIEVKSGGQGHGATFVLEIPREPREKSRDPDDFHAGLSRVQN